MSEDPRPLKEILLAILQKSRETLPEVAALSSRLDHLSSARPKLRQKDCLNPQFLVQLSQCGDRIRSILLQALEADTPHRESLRRAYNDYMQVVLDIRNYHEQAHLAHDLHKHSTQMKENLLRELKEETARRRALQAELEVRTREYEGDLAERETRIRELEEMVGEREEQINISQISQISKKVGVKYGQLYGGEERTGQLEQAGGETAKLKMRVVELEESLDQKEEELRLREQELKQKEQTFAAKMQEQQREIADLQQKFEEFTKTNHQLDSQSLKLSTLKQFHGRSTTSNSREQVDSDDLLRMLFLQAATVEEYINEQN